ncbi:MAG: methyl-accepting chemotaxis protein [Cyanophyceae cyanobacterium]
MTSVTDYEQTYEQAKLAYLQGNFAEAATIVDQLVQEYAEDPALLLLRGHIYSYGFQQYNLAQEQYRAVLELTEQPELVSFAQKGIEQIQEWESEPSPVTNTAPEPEPQSLSAPDEPLPEEEAEWLDESEQPSSEPSSVVEESLNPFASADTEIYQSADQQASDAFFDSHDDSDDPDALESEETTFIFAHQAKSEQTSPELSPPTEHPTALDDNLSAFQELELDELDDGVESPFQDELEDTAIQEERAADAGHAREDLEPSPATSIFDSPVIPTHPENGTTVDEPSFGSLSPLANPADSSAVASEEENSELLVPTATPGQLRSPMRNFSFQTKQWLIAGAAGLTSAIAVGLVGLISGTDSQNPTPRTTGMMALVGGTATLGTTLLLGQLTAQQVRRSTRNLQAQFDAVNQGNFNVQATIYSADELGQLAAGFNQMTQVIRATTQEAKQRAEETEKAREDLQRQVIRLLDDVEGAARGDLTVQAAVSADVLGAVADAFNLTIQSLREIVQQVKQAAQQVNKGSTDSESFARNQSSDALRMAEELAVTLNSVQMMTDSIERVADNAREAEEVARSSSATALKGGQAVERTVSGILQIRETVSETARKVKRLAEASQEISKIVALISQIASRTNLLAMNASIQAARAGESGRGFAVVADEVRQLADRAAKALKEIEQIVLQIQSETGGVMTAMEEGIQQVIDVTDRAEQAKESLEDIIQVSNHIDALVRSITADTVEQRENSRAVAQVMQSVELTAQETSQESQRVAGSLQSLVSISHNLLNSVERFRVSVELDAEPDTK